MKLCAVIPAAGRGTRLGLRQPKILASIGDGTTIWTILKEKLLPFVDRIHVVLSPEGMPFFQEALDSDADKARVSTSIQPLPLGMGDAIFGCSQYWQTAQSILVIWGDQVHVSLNTIGTSIELHGGATRRLALPLVPLADPYVEYLFESDGRLTAILQTREGDLCRPGGHGDVGTFVLSVDGLIAAWRAYLSDAKPGGQTGEVNFLPFLTFLSQSGWDIRRHFVTDAAEARGINTAEDLEFFRALYNRAGNEANIRENMPDRVLVTGGAGFIGSHLSERLLARGYRVRVLDNLSFGRRDWVPAAAEFVEGDIRDLDTCHAACYGVTGVFHAAAMSRVGPSMDAIDTCTQQNVVGTQNILLAARDAKVRKIVYSGSSTYYGNRPGPQREETPAEFLNFYSLSKAVGEQYCLLFDRVFSLETIVLRYFNVYGPRQPQVGAYALVLGIFLRRWMDGQTLEIHGTGEQRRDFVHVLDVADANIAAFESARHAETYNVGSGTNVSIKELADLISPDQILAPRRAGDAEVTLADISGIEGALGWQPKIGFADGLRQMMDLMKKDAA